MDVHARKMALIEWLINLQDMGILNQLESLSQQGQLQTPELSREQIAGLDHALEQIEKGEVLSGDEVRNRIKAKFSI